MADTSALGLAQFYLFSIFLNFHSLSSLVTSPVWLAVQNSLFYQLMFLWQHWNEYIPPSSSSSSSSKGSIKPQTTCDLR